MKPSHQQSRPQETHQKTKIDTGKNNEEEEWEEEEKGENGDRERDRQKGHEKARARYRIMCDTSAVAAFACYRILQLLLRPHLHLLMPAVAGTTTSNNQNTATNTLRGKLQMLTLRLKGRRTRKHSQPISEYS